MLPFDGGHPPNNAARVLCLSSAVLILAFCDFVGFGTWWKGLAREGPRMSGRAWSRLDEGQRLHEVVPRWEDQEGRDRIEVAKESSSRPELLPGRLPEVVGDVA